MLHLTQAVKGALIAHAKKATKQGVEACGVIVRVGSKRRQEYRKATNAARDPSAFFEIAQAEYNQLTDGVDVVAIAHSHSDASLTFSDADKLASDRLNIPYVLASAVGDVAYYTPAKRPEVDNASLEGRPWRLGQYDCWGLVRDYYAMQGIDLPDQKRNETTRSGADGYYARTLSELGFRLIDFADVRKGDVLLLQLAHRDPDHLALWWGENGANHMLHHAENHRSGRAVVGQYYRQRLAGVYRYGTA